MVTDLVPFTRNAQNRRIQRQKEMVVARWEGSEFLRRDTAPSRVLGLLFIQHRNVPNALEFYFLKWRLLLQ